MQDKKQLEKQAKEISESTKCAIVYADNNGDFFTDFNRAMLSVKQDKTKIETFDFTKVETKEVVSEEEKAAKAKLAILSKISNAKNAAHAQSLLKDFGEDTDVKSAIEAKVKEFEVKYTLTADDITAIPELAKANLKEGDVVGFEPSKVSKKQLLQLLGQ